MSMIDFGKLMRLNQVLDDESKKLLMSVVFRALNCENPSAYINGVLKAGMVHMEDKPV